MYLLPIQRHTTTRIPATVVFAVNLLQQTKCFIRCVSLWYTRPLICDMIQNYASTLNACAYTYHVVYNTFYLVEALTPTHVSIDETNFDPSNYINCILSRIVTYAKSTRNYLLWQHTCY